MNTNRVDLLQVLLRSLIPKDVMVSYNFFYIKTQFHWNDYTDKGYLTALSHLCDLKMEGAISAIGLCNFDTIRTDEICTQLGPGAIVSNQVQVRVFSLNICRVVSQRHM